MTSNLPILALGMVADGGLLVLFGASERTRGAFLRQAHGSGKLEWRSPGSPRSSPPPADVDPWVEAWRLVSFRSSPFLAAWGALAMIFGVICTVVATLR